MNPFYSCRLVFVLFIFLIVSEAEAFAEKVVLPILNSGGSGIIASLPIVTTDSIYAITETQATIKGTVLSEGGNSVTERGFVYSTSFNPTIEAGAKVTSGSGTGSFIFGITGLISTTTGYHVRAYAKNSVGTGYGKDEFFTTRSTIGNSIRTEGYGMILKGSGESNPYGAMQHNAQVWVVNNTWKHQYFINSTTGQRLKYPAVTTIPGSTSNLTWDTLNYLITRQNYSYTYPAKNGGSFTYQAIQYIAMNKTTGKQIELRSRGTGKGTESPYFDIYIEDDVTSGIPSTITAVRNDPKWFTYTGKTMDFVLAQTSPSEDLSGDFPTTNGWYFMDEGNGGDMGGKSFHFHTGSIIPDSARTSDLKSSYPIDFGIRWLDDSGNLKELKFLPKLISEIYSPPIFAPTVTTDSITNILAPSAKLWGKVTGDGGATVTERGFVYSVTSTPTFATGTKIVAGTGTGTFSTTVSGLTYDQTYHVRAYATNSQGTSYGADKTFRTLKNVLLIQTEGKGIINRNNGPSNPFGAMVWDGKEWVVNSTWTHRFVVSPITGERVKPPIAILVPEVNTSLVWDTLNFKITGQNYSYTYPAKLKGNYSYQAVQFNVQNKITNRQIVLRSRGTGNGTAKSYFDIYIENEDSVSKPQTITAFRGDPFWFSYSGITMDQALAQTSTSQNLNGSLNTTEGWYFLDVANGGDLGPAGVGKSFSFHTGTISSTESKIADLGSSYPIDFILRWMDDSGIIREFRFLPKLKSETWTPPVGTTVDKELGFKLDNYPNPFSESTTIRCELPEAGTIRLSLYNTLGNELSVLYEGNQPSGNSYYTLSAEKLRLSTGVYFLIMQKDDRFFSRKLIYRK